MIKSLKRITIDARSLLRPDNRPLSGIGRATLELIRSILAINTSFDITLFSQRLRGKRLAQYQFGCKTFHLPLPRIDLCNRTIQRFGIVERLCNYDLFHATAFTAPVRDVHRTVTTVYDAMFFAHPESHLGHAHMREPVRAFVQKAAAVLAPSEASKRDIVSYMDVDPGKVFITYLGVRHDHFRPADDAEQVRDRLRQTFSLHRPFFFSVSCGIGRKNSPRVLRCYLKLARNNPRNDLVMVWHNPPDEIHATLSAQPVSVRKRVRLIPSVSDDELRDLYCAATATLFPSLYEGFGFPVLESMACGTPAVTSAISSLPEVGGDAVLYVNPEGDDDVVRTFEMFENGDPRVQDLGTRGLQRAAKFTWEKCARETLQVYEKCLDD